MNNIDQMLTTLYQHNPTTRFAKDRKTASMIAYYDETRQEFYPYCTKTITGDWVRLPYEILANGLRMIELTPGNTCLVPPFIYPLQGQARPAPNLLDLFLYRRGDRRVADVRVDLH